MSLIEKGRQVADLRRQCEALLELLSSLEDELKGTPLGQRISAERRRLDEVKTLLNRAEVEFKDALLADYRKRQVKKPVLGGEIKVYKQYDYLPGKLREWLQGNAPAYLRVRPDDETVRAWAMEHSPEAVEIDEQAVKKTGASLVRLGAPIEILGDPRPQITKDLARLLEDDAPEDS